MILTLITLNLRAEWCLSLKHKRAATRPIIAGVRSRFNVSACESGKQDVWTLIEISIAYLAFDAAQADSICQNILDYIEASTEAEIIETRVEKR